MCIVVSYSACLFDVASWYVTPHDCKWFLNVLSNIATLIFVKMCNMWIDLHSPKITKMENAMAGSAVPTDFECATSQGQARLTENISLISLSHLHHQISVKLNHFPLKGQNSVTHSREDSGLYSFTSKWGRKSDEGPKVLIQQSYFMADAALSPLFVPVKLIWSHAWPLWYDAGSHQFATWWGEGNGGWGGLIVRSLGAGTDDPLGAFSAFVRRASRLKFPTSLRESQD